MKQLPPNPGLGDKNLFPILVSWPIAFTTSSISAPVDSHNAVIELMELNLCARKAFAINLESSLLQIFVKRIFYSGIHFT